MMTSRKLVRVGKYKISEPQDTKEMSYNHAKQKNIFNLGRNPMAARDQTQNQKPHVLLIYHCTSKLLIITK